MESLVVETDCKILKFVFNFDLCFLKSNICQFIKDQMGNNKQERSKSTSSRFSKKN